MLVSLYIPLLYIAVIIGIREETPVLHAVYVLLHRCKIQRQAKARSQEWIILDVRTLDEGLRSRRALKHGDYWDGLRGRYVLLRA